MPVDPTQVQAVFAAAVECEDPAARVALLDRQCGNDAELRARVEALLKAHDDPDSLPRGPCSDPKAALGGAATFIGTSPYSAGMLIAGRYKLLEEIAEGGMGSVWVAQQTEPVRRRVALKLVKPGMDTRQVLSRFEVERQALALMDHPNIAKVLDGGVTDAGRPFFVMEYVKGVPITNYCDDARLDLQARLKLFVKVCRAVQHAHQKGIIHRDLKPSNILVCLYDGHPVPKVIDFGLAKAMHQQLTEHTLFTAHGLMVGTPLYMSPEQAEFNNLDIDTRTDVYSLGVILYELLTGTTPLEKQQFKNAALQEILRLIKEEEPSRPSTKISGSASLPTIAAQRSLDPAQLRRAVQGDLDWIVMKSLEKERSRRYDTANGLARDIDRYLNDESVEACPPSATYRFRKFARRNRVALTTLVLVSAALIGGTAVSTLSAIRAMRAEQWAQDMLVETQDAWRSEAEQRQLAEQQRNEAIAARKGEAAQRIAAEENLQKARKAVDEYFTLVSESTLLDVPGLQPLRKQLLDAALTFYQGFAAERTDDPAVLVDLAVTNMRVAEINHTVDRNDDAVAAINRALDAIDRLRRDYPNAGEPQRRLAGYWKGFRRAHVATEMPKDPEAAFRSLSRLIGMWETLSKEFPDELRFQSDLAALLHRVGDLLATGGQVREAVPMFERSRDLLEKLAHDHPEVPEYRADLARSYQYLAANLMLIGGNGPEATRAARKALTLREQLVAENRKLAQHRQDLAFSLVQCADQMKDDKDGVETEDYYRRALSLMRTLLLESPTMPVHVSRYCDACTRLSSRLIQRGAYDEAESILRQAIELDLKHVKDSPGDVDARNRLLNLYVNWFRALSATGHTQEAEEVTRLVMSTVGDDPHRLNGIAWGSVCSTNSGDVAARYSVMMAQKAVELARNDPDRAMIWNTLGVAHYREGNRQAAENAFRMSMRFGNGGNAIDWFFLAMIDWRNGKQDRAKKWYRAASMRMQKLASQDEELKNFRGEAQALLQIDDQIFSDPIDHLAVANALIDADAGEASLRYRAFVYLKMNDSPRALQDLDKAISLDPDVADSRIARANMHIRAGRWTEAVPDAVRYLELRPEDEYFQYQVACLLGRVGDLAAYRQLARKMLDQYANTNAPEWAERAAKTCLILPVSGDDLADSTRLANRAVTADPNHWIVPFAQVAMAMAAYRNGQFFECVEWSEKALRAPNEEELWFRSAEAHYLRALALVRLGKSLEAKAALDDAAAIVKHARAAANTNGPPEPWHDFAICELLQREAEESINSSSNKNSSK